ncbi:hypothetical protein Tco_0447970 [Tanacetum coccineum]
MKIAKHYKKEIDIAKARQEKLDLGQALELARSWIKKEKKGCFSLKNQEVLENYKSNGKPYRGLQLLEGHVKRFDRDDLEKLWDLVKKKFSSTEPTIDKEKVLWVELKRLFEPDDDDTLWKL